MHDFRYDLRSPGTGMAPHGGLLRTATAGPRHSVIDQLIDRVACCPWSATAGVTAHGQLAAAQPRRPLYTAEERSRRDMTPWTMVQGVLAPIQFAVFLISLGLVLNYLLTDQGYAVATASIVLKTAILYIIMLTGSIWEKRVFGRYLFAPAFFWEDVVSMLVLFLHTAYLVQLTIGEGSARDLMLLALAAYASYVVNATQFLLKLRSARLDSANPVRLATGSAK